MPMCNFLFQIKCFIAQIVLVSLMVLDFLDRRWCRWDINCQWTHPRLNP